MQPPSILLVQWPKENLSVSAFGSNHLQPCYPHDVPHFTPTFQYPRSDRITCNKNAAPLIAKWPTPFSIRVRIESLATVNVCVVWSVRFHFQYPRSDRITCNVEWIASHRALNDLSVSAFGSNHLQPPDDVESRVSRYAFQYPRSDRITCNLHTTSAMTATYALSVSAFGSNHLQRVPRLNGQAR